MDALSAVFRKIKLRSAIYFKSDFASPWGMDIPEGPYAQFHMVSRGRCLLKTKNGLQPLFSGDVVIFPFGLSHWLADTNKSKRPNGKEVVQAIRGGANPFTGTNIATTLICGHFEFDRSIDHPFIKELPEVLIISNLETREFYGLEHICELIMREAENVAQGSMAITTKLAEVLFIHVLRAHAFTTMAETGFFAALQDSRISRVLKRMHEAPEQDWQLSGLAQLAGMSRTSFSNRFKYLLGETPIKYLTHWRILHAKELLEESNRPVGKIAEEIGYESEAAFIRAFKKRVKTTPLKYRQSLLIS